MWGGHFWLQLVFSGLEQSRRAIQETVQERDTWATKTGCRCSRGGEWTRRVLRRLSVLPGPAGLGRSGTPLHPDKAFPRSGILPEFLGRARLLRPMRLPRICLQVTAACRGATGAGRPWRRGKWRSLKSPRSMLTHLLSEVSLPARATERPRERPVLDAGGRGRLYAEGAR